MGDGFRAGFLVVGAQKCATTSLLDRLGSHPRIGACSVKEPNLFGREDWREGLEAYHALFPDHDVAVAGEASPHYTSRPEREGVAARIHEYEPAMRILYIVRHPVDRIVSAYAHRLVRGGERHPPERAVERYAPYLDMTRYAYQIRPYLELFPRERVRLVVMEEYVATQRETLDGIAAFLGVEPFPADEADARTHRHRSVGVEYGTYRLQKLHASRWFLRLRVLVPGWLRAAVKRKWFKRRLDEMPEFPSDLRRDLWNRLEPEVEGIEEILGRRLDVWRHREP